jgi:uncharacterized pyridoxamine 5'-phosphate oxidase family protein
MYESENDIEALQTLIDRTFSHAKPHLAGIVKPERRLSARQIVRYLQGTKHVAFATVNERGEPRVAPLDGVFIRGQLTVSTGGQAARLKHLRANPACSAAHFDGDTIGIVIHGHATIIGRDDEGVEAIEPIWREIYGSSPFEWGDGVAFMRVEASSMWGYASEPGSFPEFERIQP